MVILCVLNSKLIIRMVSTKGMSMKFVYSAIVSQRVNNNIEVQCGYGDHSKAWLSKCSLSRWLSFLIVVAVLTMMLYTFGAAAQKARAEVSVFVVKVVNNIQ